jgi:hypothetical protein
MLILLVYLPLNVEQIELELELEPELDVAPNRALPDPPLQAALQIPTNEDKTKKPKNK